MLLGLLLVMMLVNALLTGPVPQGLGEVVVTRACPADLDQRMR